MVRVVSSSVQSNNKRCFFPSIFYLNIWFFLPSYGWDFNFNCDYSSFDGLGPCWKAATAGRSSSQLPVILHSFAECPLHAWRAWIGGLLRRDWESKLRFDANVRVSANVRPDQEFYLHFWNTACSLALGASGGLSPAGKRSTHSYLLTRCNCLDRTVTWSP